MRKCAVLIGDAPKDFRQTKIEDMMDFLETKEGGEVKAGDSIVFPNGVSELMLETILNGIMDSKPDHLFIYFCTREPVRSGEEVIWCGGEEIRKDVIAYYQNLAEKDDINLQIIYDVQHDYVSDEELGYEKV